MAGRIARWTGGSFLVLALVVGSGCSDDEVVDRTPPTTTTVPGEPSLGEAGSHDASVIVHFSISGDGSGSDPAVDALAELEDRLVDAIEPSGIGELDGDVFGEGEVTISIYGPDLDRLWDKVRPILETYYARPAYAELRDGGPDQPAKRIELGPVPTTTTAAPRSTSPSPTTQPK